MDNDVTVELEVDGVWTDITRISDKARVLVDPGDPGIRMTYGASDASPGIPPGVIEFAYVDSDGLLDVDNYASPWYRKVGPGTPLRVLEGGTVQQVGEFAAALPDWDAGGRHPDGTVLVIATVSTSDVKGRLTDNDPPVESAMSRFYRDCSTNADYELLHWWSFEDGAAATRVESNYGGRPMTGIGPFGNDDGPPGAARALQQVYEARPSPLSDLSTNLQVVDLVSHYEPREGENWTIELSGKFPGVAVDDDLAPSVLLEWRTHGTPGVWQIRADPTTKCWELYYFNHPLQAFTLTTATVARDGEWHLVRIEIEHDSPDLDAYVYVDGELIGSELAIGIETSPPKAAYVNNFEDVDGSIRPAISHVTMWAGTSTDGRVPLVDEPYAAFTGHTDEGAWQRFTRVTAENGVDFVGGNDGNALGLGPQDELPLAEILDASARSDSSWWFAHLTLPNTVQRLGLADLYNQLPAFIATYDQLSRPLRPLFDNRVGNVVTATNAGATGETGAAVARIPDDDLLHWPPVPPPVGAYAKPDSLATNLADVDEVGDVAAWVAHERSWREKRFAALTYELAKGVFTADDIADVRALRIGSMIAQGMVGAPAWVPYTQVRAIVRGWTRTLGKVVDTYVFATVPADIYEVVTTDSSGSTLVAAIDDNDTTARIATSEGPPWNPLTTKLQIDGDPVGVTAMATATRTYIAAGVMAHADNATVNPALPAGITPDVGQSLFCFAACRTTTAEVGATPPTGWAEIPLDPTLSTPITHVKLFHRYYVTGDGAPAVTVTGGAAGNSVSAVTFAFSGVSPHTDNTDDVGGVKVSENASAQNITFPTVPVRTTRLRGLRENGVMQLMLGWKQDDWTSVAPPGTHTEMFDGSTTTGNDQGLWGAYRDTSIPTAHTGAAVTVTGGAAAISKGFVVSLRPLQTATITRGVYGTPTSHTEGDEVHAWHMGVTAL